MVELGPAVQLVDGARARAAVERLLAEVESNLLALTSSMSDAESPRHFAALGLARGVRLCRAIAVLVDAGMRDVAKLPLRPALETVVLSFYTLYGGIDAYDHARGAWIRDLGQLGNEVAGTSELAGRWDGPTERIRWEQLCRTVGELVAERTGEPTAKEAFRQAYDLIYRGASSMAIHAGAGTFGGHLDPRDGTARGVSLVSYVPEDGTSDLLMATSYVGMLACLVVREFGRSPVRVRALYDEVAALGNELQADNADGQRPPVA